MENDEVLNCVGMDCPSLIAKTVQKMAEMKTGQILEIVTDNPDIKEDIHVWCRKTGNEFISVEEMEGKTRVKVRKGF